MRWFHYNPVWLPLLCLVVGVGGGCTSDHGGDGIGYAVLGKLIPGTQDVPFWVDRFWERKGRLPYDYEELTAFVAQRTNGKARLESYPRVDFSLLSTGQRHADFYSVTNGMTNVASRVTWGETKGDVTLHPR